MCAENSALRFLPYTSNDPSLFTGGMLSVLGIKTRVEPARDGEIKPGDLSTELEHMYYEEGEFELLGWRNLFSWIKIYCNRFSKIVKKFPVQFCNKTPPRNVTWLYG